jgi:WD40 repeat protein/tRNA A-37 threonylcarbamoyl transferase component Bud32
MSASRNNVARFEERLPRADDPGERATGHEGSTPAADGFPDRPAIPGYDILRPLAAGGMGAVFQAKQHHPERLVAIKIIRPERLGHRAAIRRFQREARIAARMSHPNIVQVLRADWVNDLHYLVMEYVEGTDLARRVKQGGPLPVGLACDCIRQSALGLQHAFEKGLVHRDIKPGNLMLTTASPVASAPGGGVIKILDLGLARLRGDATGEESDSHMTLAGSVLGTPDFMAPEQFEDPHRADIRADLYSLGCTFFYLLTGQVVFPGGSMVQKLDRHRWQPPPAVTSLRPYMSSSVGDIVSRLLAKRPEERFQTPGELAAALKSNVEIPRPVELPEVQTDAPATVTLSGHRAGITGVVFLPDGSRCVSTSLDGTLRLWDAISGREILQVEAHDEAALCVAVAPDGQRLATGSSDGRVRLWDTASGRELSSLIGHSGGVTSVAFGPDGGVLLSGGMDQTVRLWNLETGRERRRIGGTVAERHWDAVLSVAFAPDGKRALSGSRDQTLRLWDLKTGRELRCLRGLTLPVAGVTLAPDGRRALSGGSHAVCLWDLDTGEVLRRFEGHSRAVLSVAFSPDGQLSVSGSEDMTVRVWDVEISQELHCFTGHTGAVASVTFSPDGRAVLSGSADGSVRLWRLMER